MLGIRAPRPRRRCRGHKSAVPGWLEEGALHGARCYRSECPATSGPPPRGSRKHRGGTTAVARVGTIRAVAPARLAPRGVSSMVEQWTFNPLVQGSSPWRPTASSPPLQFHPTDSAPPLLTCDPAPPLLTCDPAT